MADKFKPTIINQLELKNRLSIIANHYGSADMRFDFIKIPKIEFVEIDGDEVINCLNILKKGSPFLKYEYFESPNKIIEIKLIYIKPKIFNKQIGPKEIKYITLSHFNMIGTIHFNDLKEIDRLVYQD